MMIARWKIDARFGHKEEAVTLLKQWMEEVGSQVGWTGNKVRLLTGSVGTPESTIISEVSVEDLTDLNNAWNKMATLKGHAEWSKKLEPLVVSGTNRWEVLRVV